MGLPLAAEEEKDEVASGLSYRREASSAWIQSCKTEWLVRPVEKEDGRRNDGPLRETANFVLELDQRPRGFVACA